MPSAQIHLHLDPPDLYLSRLGAHTGILSRALAYRSILSGSLPGTSNKRVLYIPKADTPTGALSDSLSSRTKSVTDLPPLHLDA